MEAEILELWLEVRHIYPSTTILIFCGFYAITFYYFMFTYLVRMTDLEDKDYCESVIDVFVDGLHEIS